MGYDPNTRADETSFKLVTRNYRVLKRVLDTNEDLTNAITAGFRPEIVEEVNINLHNYVSSVMSLISHTRELNKKLYTKAFPKALEEIQQEINNRFANNETHQIIQGLRDYTQHRKLPVAGRAMSFNVLDNTPSLKVNYYLSTDSLLEWDGWKPLARKSLEDMKRLTTGEHILSNTSSDIAVNRLVTEHYKQMAGFYDWLYGKRREWMMRKHS